jgi:hypothetical protein
MPIYLAAPYVPKPLGKIPPVAAHGRVSTPRYLRSSEARALVSQSSVKRAVEDDAMPNEQEARDAGTWLEVHHTEPGQSSRDETHDVSTLRVVCRQPCHLKTLRRPDKPKKWAEHVAKVRRDREAVQRR